MRLWVDDVRPAPGRLVDRNKTADNQVGAWIWSKTSKDAISVLKDWWDLIDVVSLDHDLGGDDTGYKILIFIEYQVAIEGRSAPMIEIHTANPAARERMEAAVTSIIAFDRQNRMG